MQGDNNNEQNGQVINVRSLFKTSKEMVEEAYSNIIKYQRHEFVPAKTGYKYLDDALLGGLYPQNVITIGARPGVGKSFVAQKIMENVMNPMTNPQSRDYLLVNCEFEMTPMDLLNRRISRGINKSISKFLLNAPTSVEADKIRRILEEEMKSNIIYIPEPITVSEFRDAVNHIMRRNMDKRLVIWKIDHILLFKRDGGDAKKTMDAAIAVMNEAKLKYHNIMFVVVSQFNRNIEERRNPKEHEPRMSDFYQSDELGQLCSLMVGLNNPRRFGYDSYMLFPADWYRSLERFKTPSKRSFRTDGLLFHHILKVRQIRIEELTETIYPEIMPGYGGYYGEGSVKYVNTNKPPEPPRDYTIDPDEDTDMYDEAPY